MASKKKRQHYIPRFYLKRFSSDDLGKLIGLYNHKNDVYIEKAPLRHQAYKNFLYGEDDEVENALADLEGKVAKMFYYWTEEKLFYPPPPKSNGLKFFQRFLLYQIFRTPKLGEDILDNLNDSVAKMLKSFKPELCEKLKGHRIIHNDIVLLNLLNSVGREHLLDYLEFKFVVNLSEIPLVTSDAPVILYNQLMESADNYTGATGLPMKGLQIFYPIHPRLLLCLFDSEVYECDKDYKNCTDTELIEDIHQLNALQFINSHSQLFFNDIFSKSYFELLKKNFSSFRNTDKNKSRALEIEDRKFLFISSESPKIGLNLSFFKTIVDPSKYKNHLPEFRHSTFYDE